MKRILGRLSKDIVAKHNLWEHENKKIVIYDNDRKHCEKKHAHQFKNKKTFHYIMDNLEYIIENPDEVFYVKGYDIEFDKNTRTKIKVERHSLEYYKKFAGDITVRVRVDDGRELKVKTVFPVGKEKVANKKKKELYDKYVLTEEEIEKREEDKLKVTN